MTARLRARLRRWLFWAAVALSGALVGGLIGGALVVWFIGMPRL